MGMEPFDERLTPEIFHKIVSKRSQPIKTILLNQGIIAGIGNIYASEVLFDAGIDPRRSARGILLKEIDRLLYSIRTILTAAIASNGTTIKDFKLSNGKGGDFASFLKVYAKKGENCIKCEGKITRIVQAQRSTFFCSHCQV